MSANATATARIADRAKAVPDADEGIGSASAPCTCSPLPRNLAIFIYGFDYYKLSAIDRPFSPKHHLLRPSGPIGLYLGFVGRRAVRWAFSSIRCASIGRGWDEGQHAALARYSRADGAHGALHHRVPLDSEVQGHRRHGFLDHVRGFGQRRRRTLSLRADPAQGDHRGTVDEGTAGTARDICRSNWRRKIFCPKPTCGPCCACPTRSA